MNKFLKIPVFYIVISLTTLFSSMMIMGSYLTHPLLFSSFNQYFLPAKMFGVPQELQEKGIKPLYTDDKNTGWDGQFYYYIANDPLALKDTSKHIDSDAYRYQRIGLPLLAKVLSLVVFQQWVSPLLYYITSLLLILIATIAGASFFKERKISPYWILLWSLGIGTQLTLLNGLPDAAADSLLIISLVCLMRKHYSLYAITASLAALSREAYILIPIFIFLSDTLSFSWLKSLKTLKDEMIQKFSQGKFWLLLLPLCLFIGWQLYIRLRFGSPLQQSGGTLDGPFYSAWHFMILGWKNQHPIVGSGINSYREAIGICLFITLLCICLVQLLSSFKKNMSDKKIMGIVVGFFTIIFLYFFFGPIVMMHYTGYMKAGNIFFFLFFFMMALNAHHLKQTFLKKSLISFSILFILFSGFFFDRHFMEDRVLAPPSPNPYNMTENIIYATQEPPCLKNFNAQTNIISMKNPLSNTLFNRLFVSRYRLIKTKVTNTGKETLYPYPGKGGVNLSYHWLNALGSHDVLVDGIRTPLIHALQPGESVILSMMVNYPRLYQRDILKISLVQEGCNWFYIANPASSTTIYPKV